MKILVSQRIEYRYQLEGVPCCNWVKENLDLLSVGKEGVSLKSSPYHREGYKDVVLPSCPGCGEPFIKELQPLNQNDNF